MNRYFNDLIFLIRFVGVGFIIAVYYKISFDLISSKNTIENIFGIFVFSITAYSTYKFLVYLLDVIFGIRLEKDEE
jgi:hypothetical protein